MFITVKLYTVGYTSTVDHSRTHTGAFKEVSLKLNANFALDSSSQRALFTNSFVKKTVVNKP